MGFGFRKTIKIAPGLKINLSKSGPSLSVGGKGLTYNSRGRVTANIPGTGIRYTASAKSRSPRSKALPRLPHQMAQSSAGDFSSQNGDVDFAMQAQMRVSNALLTYFYSHGICTSRDDLDQAMELPAHKALMDSLAPQFFEMADTLRLVRDIGSLSIHTKEATMRSVYLVENRLAIETGAVSGLGNALIDLHEIAHHMPTSPTLILYGALFLISILLLVEQFTVFGLICIIASLIGVPLYFQFRQKKAKWTQAEFTARKKVESLVRLSITPIDDLVA